MGACARGRRARPLAAIFDLFAEVGVLSKAWKFWSWATTELLALAYQLFSQPDAVEGGSESEADGDESDSRWAGYLNGRNPDM